MKLPNFIRTNEANANGCHYSHSCDGVKYNNIIPWNCWEKAKSMRIIKSHKFSELAVFIQNDSVHKEIWNDISSKHEGRINLCT